MNNSNYNDFTSALGGSLLAVGNYIDTVGSSPSSVFHEEYVRGLGPYTKAAGAIMTVASAASDDSPIPTVAGLLAGYLVGRSAAAAVGFFVGGPIGLGLALLAGTVFGGLVDGVVSDLFEDLFDNPLASPLVLDLNGNGIELTSLSTSPTMFNLDHDNFLTRTGWVKATDGLLALDKNGDGHITSGHELFGNYTDNGYTDGFDALRAYDSNGDNKITTADTVFANLRVWQDANQNGFSEITELKTLAQHGITAINLNDVDSSQIIAGHPISSTATFIQNGQARTIADAWFEQNPINSFYIPPAGSTFDEAVLDMPNLRGHGKVKDLWFAMSEDADLKAQVQGLMNQNFNAFDFEQFCELVEGMLFNWAGTDDVGIFSRGVHIDARILETIELLLDRRFDQEGDTIAIHSAGDNPRTNMSAALEKAWDEFVADQATKLLYGIVHAPLNQAFETVLNEIVTQLNAGATVETLPSGYVANLLNTEIAEVMPVVQSHPLYHMFEHQYYDYFGDRMATNSASSSIGFSLYIDNLVAEEPATSSARQDYWNDLLPMINAVADGMRLSDAEYEAALAGTYLDTITSDNLAVLRDGNVIIGTSGNDTITSGNTGDYLVGGLGNDSIIGGYGNDTFGYYLGDGHDTISDTGLANDTLLLGSGIAASQLSFTRSGSNDLVIGLPDGGSIKIIRQFNFSNDEIEIIQLDDGTLYTEADIRSIILSKAKTLGNDTIIGFNDNDLIAGGEGNDSLVGDSGNDTIHGENGNDIVKGDGGNDSLTAGNGTDTVEGGSGNDTVFGNGNGDSLVGGSGADTYMYLKGDGADTIYDNGINGESDSIIIKTYASTSAVYTRVANTDDFRITFIDSTTDSILIREGLEAGRDTLEQVVFTSGGSKNIAQIRAEVMAKQITTGNDVVHGFNGMANTINGLAGKDTLVGKELNDILIGDAGNDSLSGGLGVDSLTGGGEADRFSFNKGDMGTGSNTDVITDFNRSSGDKIALLGYGLDSSGFKGTGAMTAGGIIEFNYAKLSDATGNFTLIRVDANNDGVSDQEVRLQAIHLDMIATDFVFV